MYILRKYVGKKNKRSGSISYIKSFVTISKVWLPNKNINFYVEQTVLCKFSVNNVDNRVIT